MCLVTFKRRSLRLWSQLFAVAAHGSILHENARTLTTQCQASPDSQQRCFRVDARKAMGEGAFCRT